MLIFPCLTTVRNVLGVHRPNYDCTVTGQLLYSPSRGFLASSVQPVRLRLMLKVVHSDFSEVSKFEIPTFQQMAVLVGMRDHLN